MRPHSSREVAALSLLLLYVTYAQRYDDSWLCIVLLNIWACRPPLRVLRSRTVSSAAPRRDSCHQTRLIPLLVHLSLPLRLFLRRIALHAHRVPAHVVATDWEQDCVNSDPSKENAKVQADPRVKIEKDRARELGDCANQLTHPGQRDGAE